jgi:uncharacterized protein (TIGR00369 family)
MTMQPASQPPRQLTDANPAGMVGHSRWLGIEVLASGDGWIEMQLPAAAAPFVGHEGFGMASGAIVSLVDSAAGAAVVMKMDQRRSLATLDMRIDLVRKPRPGTALQARGECYSLVGDVALSRCVVHDGDATDPVASAMASFCVG